MTFLTIIFNSLLIFNVFNTGLSADTGVCYPPLGCFNITEDFKYNIIYRPINLLPESPERLNTLITFYSRKTDKKGQILDPKWWKSDKLSSKLENFDGNKESKFIIHGFMDSKETGKWMIKLKNELLTKGDYNVFVVDWSEWNGMPYSQAVANSRVIGAQIALLIKNLNTTHKINYNLVHLMGHSLGAHLASYTGKNIKKYSGKLGRITGLDPAEPYFQNMPSSVRLDRNDAEFVDVLHTDTKSILQGGLGMSQPVGHIDFYPNGGNEQPGCSQDRVASFLSGAFMNERTGVVVACNHLRAVEYFTESIKAEGNGCQFTGYACESWTAFSIKNRCSSCGKNGGLCAQMGLNAIQWKRFKSNKKSKKFYLKTDSSPPFCIFQVKIEIPVTSIGEESEFYHGKIRMKMISGSNTSYINLNELNLISNNSYSSVAILKDKKVFSSLDSIDLKWFEEKFDVFSPSSWSLTIFNQKMEQDNRIVKKELFIKQINIKPLYSGSKPKKFCNKNSGAGIKPEKYVKFNKNC